MKKPSRKSVRASLKRVVKRQPYISLWISAGRARALVRALEIVLQEVTEADQRAGQVLHFRALKHAAKLRDDEVIPPLAATYLSLLPAAEGFRWVPGPKAAKWLKAERVA